MDEIDFSKGFGKININKGFGEKDADEVLKYFHRICKILKIIYLFW